MYKKLLAGLLLTGFASVSHAVPIANFLIDGDTYNRPFTIVNNSDQNEEITRVTLDLAGTGIVFDTVDGGAPNTTYGVAFRPRSNSAIRTGLISPSTVDDGSTLLDMLFSDFQSGERFRFDIDVYQATGSPTVLGNELIGATLSIDFSDGQRVLGELLSVRNNRDAAQFVATGITQTPSDVPEPAALALFGIGFFAFGIAGRLKRRT